MFTLFQQLPVRRLLTEQAPALLVSLIIAEIFYKFHSFTLETGAFLTTWFLIDAAIQGVLRAYHKISTDRTSI